MNSGAGDRPQAGRGGAGGRRYRTTAAAPPPPLRGPEAVDPADRALMAQVGVFPGAASRGGTYLQRDFFPICLAALSPDIELLPIRRVLDDPDLCRRYAWKAVPPDTDDYTRQCAGAADPQGFYLRVMAGARLSRPIQACLYITEPDILQAVHNIVVIEDGAEAHVITGCAMREDRFAGAHVGITEAYVGRGARLTSTMVHSWSPQSVVRPRSGTRVDADGRYTEQYCSLRPAGSVHLDPRVRLEGDGASAELMTVVLGSAGAEIDLSGQVDLLGRDARAELGHRAVCTGGRIHQRGLLVGRGRCRGHVDCAGLVLDAGEDGYIQSVPGLQSLHPEAQLSHEASIGRIAPDQVEYLQTRGLEERAAISLLIRGFLGGEWLELGPELDRRIDEIARLAGHGET